MTLFTGRPPQKKILMETYTEKQVAGAFYLGLFTGAGIMFLSAITAFALIYR